MLEFEKLNVLVNRRTAKRLVRVERRVSPHFE